MHCIAQVTAVGDPFQREAGHPSSHPAATQPRRCVVRSPPSTSTSGLLAATSPAVTAPPVRQPGGAPSSYGAPHRSPAASTGPPRPRDRQPDRPSRHQTMFLSFHRATFLFSRLAILHRPAVPRSVSRATLLDTAGLSEGPAGRARRRAPEEQARSRDFPSIPTVTDRVLEVADAGCRWAAGDGTVRGGGRDLGGQSWRRSSRRVAASASIAGSTWP